MVLSKTGKAVNSYSHKIGKFVLFVICIAPLVWGNAVAGAEAPKVESEEAYENLPGPIKHMNGGLYLAQLSGDEINIVNINESGQVKTENTIAKREISKLASFTNTNDSGFVFAGWTEDEQLCVMEVDGSGKLKWEKRVDGEFDSFLGDVDVEQLQDGSIILTAEKALEDPYIENDIYLAKVTNTGATEWEKTIGDQNYYDKVSSIVPTRDGGFLFLGELGKAVYEKPHYDNYTDLYIAKYDTSGKQEWEKRYESGLNTNPELAIETSDGGFLIAANNYTDYVIMPIDGYISGYCVKLDKSGDQEWESTLPKSIAKTRIKDIQQTDDGGYIIAGRANYDVDQDTFVETRNTYLRKIDKFGEEEWEKIIKKGEQTMESVGVLQTKDGGYVTLIKDVENKTWYVTKMSEK